MDTRKTFPPLPRVHALSSATFRTPPAENLSLTLPEIFDWHLEHSPNHRLFLFPLGDGTVKTITWAEEVRAMHRGAGIIHSRLGTASVATEPPVVAIIAPSDAIPYYTTIVSIIRANCAAFLVSPRNSPLAVAHLINKVGVSHILVSRDQAMQDLVNEALDILTTRYGSKQLPTQSPMLLFEDLFPPLRSADDYAPPPYVNSGPEARAIILHSSGSTAFPKPMVTTNYLALQAAMNAWFGERDLTDKVFSLHAIPMFHGMGIAMLAWTASSGIVLSTFQSKSPAPIPAPDSIFAAAKATDCDFIVSVPTIVETWAKKPDYVRWLATRSGVLYGGGPLDKDTGDYLTTQGAQLFILYGTTEAGIISPILPAEAGQDWDYFKFSKQFTPHMVPYGDNTFELVMRANPYYRPGVVNTTVDGVEAYATSDLLKPHPTKPGYWKVFGRTDDQIMHNTGEKTNPGPLENMLNQDPHVQSSVMFGRGQFQAGILVDPKPPYKFDPVDETKLAEFRNLIWPTVERMNAYAPQHSRLFKEMIIVANPSKPFTYTAKGTVRRQAVIEEYAEEIDALYAKVEDSTQASIPPPLHWDLVTALDFVRKVVSKVLVHGVGDDDDLFEHGCDSLQATYIRNALLRALRDSAQLDTRSNVGNFVYEHKTIHLLASFLLGIATGHNVDAGYSLETQSEKMAAMAAKYLEDLPSRAVPRLENPSGNVVLLTGTTGSLGAYVLARLVDDPAVDRVYALNRPAVDGRSLQSRQKSALQERGLDANALEHSKVVLLEADLSVSGFSIPQDLWAEMHASVTHVIHNAWRVDFNLVLESFEPNVRGVRNLIEFALSSPLPRAPRFIFISTIGIFQNTEGTPLTEHPIEPQVAVGTGYSESKWVAERVLTQAAQTKSLEALIVRVGQVCGGPNGAWNAHEWFPAVVQSAHKVGCFPDDPRVVSWLPLDAAAVAVAGLVHAPAGKEDIIHLIHPRPVPWSSLAVTTTQELDVALVPYNEWVLKLEALSASGQSEVELLRTDDNAQALNFPSLSVTRATQLCPTLRETTPLGANDVKRWLDYWRGIGFI
ncbi:hypothetical protein FOMPIDRAFT_1038850 [Fomitopsis schrenkii]|uniref:Polyketide synthase-like phosphopantetheine-binding domain-containing protein n=1 Tax=Fomitopsis schrenkii TaxID=2126942 RepID=S8DT61_FOMSC|nr:hypothetical protein FOMPIDRAFT_1038850 [Fomitopsis schrenkii]